MSQDEFLIFHISDLHFDREFYPRLNRLTAPVVPRAPLVATQGFFPHDLGACEELENEIKAIKLARKPRRVLLIVSGDLTRKGDDSEFVTALTYLKSRFRRDWSGFIGLGPHVSEVFSIPGNHDHWRGSSWHTVASGLSPIHDIYFACLPGQLSWYQTLEEGGVQLQLIGIDSRDPSATTVAARGSLDINVLKALTTKINIADSDAKLKSLIPVRVLILHHSPEYRGSSRWVHELDVKSRNELDIFCNTNKIHFVLTGHVHEPIVRSGTIKHTYGMELRCGTTLQGAPIGNLPGKLGNIFLLHTISGSSGNVNWTSELYQRASFGPFTDAPTHKIGPLTL